MDFLLYFDGSCQPNPGQGAAAAVCYDVTTTKTLIFSESAPLGDDCTSNIAEYYGLILGLRHLLRSPPPPPKTFSPHRPVLTICGDSQLVINQLQGTYEVRNKRLKNYYNLAKTLIARLQMYFRVDFKRIPREENTEADALARIMLQPSQEWKEYSECYYPNLIFAWDVDVFGRTNLASCDIMTSYQTDVCFMDLDYYLSIAGEEAYAKLEDPHSITRLAGKASTTVFGVIYNLPLTIRMRNDHYVEEWIAEEVLVIDELPVPFHLSGFMPKVELRMSGSPNLWKFEKKVFPPKYRSHKYWDPNGPMFLPYW